MLDSSKEKTITQNAVIKLFDTTNESNAEMVILLHLDKCFSHAPSPFDTSVVRAI